jgi:hypothetical protein
MNNFDGPPLGMFLTSIQATSFNHRELPVSFREGLSLPRLCSVPLPVRLLAVIANLYARAGLQFVLAVSHYVVSRAHAL